MINWCIYKIRAMRSPSRINKAGFLVGARMIIRSLGWNILGHKNEGFRQSWEMSIIGGHGPRHNNGGPTFTFLIFFVACLQDVFPAHAELLYLKIGNDMYRSFNFVALFDKNEWNMNKHEWNMIEPHWQVSQISFIEQEEDSFLSLTIEII